MNGLSKLVGLAFAVGFVALFVSTAHAEPSQSLSCSQAKVVGCVLTTLDGVDVYYNGMDPTSDQAAYAFGYAWQCVELVQRYYAEVYNYPAMWAPLYAYQTFDDWGHPSRMIAYPNGSATAPQKGDILVFGPTGYNPYGHVALVKAVANGQVSFVQQNVGDIGEDSLLIDSNNNISSRYPYGDVRGWLRDRSAPSQPIVEVPDVALNSQWVRVLAPVPSWDPADSLFPVEQEPETVRPPVLATPTPGKAAAPAATPTPPTPTPTPTALPTTGQLILVNWWGRGDADFTINGQMILVRQNGVPVTLTLPPGHYAWTFHLAEVTSQNGDVDIGAGEVAKLEFWQR